MKRLACQLWLAELCLLQPLPAESPSLPRGSAQCPAVSEGPGAQSLAEPDPLLPTARQHSPRARAGSRSEGRPPPLPLAAMGWSLCPTKKPPSSQSCLHSELCPRAPRPRRPLGAASAHGGSVGCPCAVPSARPRPPVHRTPSRAFTGSPGDAGPDFHRPRPQATLLLLLSTCKGDSHKTALRRYCPHWEGSNGLLRVRGATWAGRA